MRLKQSAITGAIKKVCANHPVALAYLIGSYASGNEDEDSDVDIAFRLDDSLSRSERDELRIDLITQIHEELQHPDVDVDLIILQDAPILLQYNIIHKGIRVFESDRSQRVHYANRVEQLYDDERYYLERESNSILNHILSCPL